MEKYYHLNTTEDQDTGAFVYNSYPYFDSSSPSGFSSLQSMTDHKPLFLDNPYQTTTTAPLISSDSHLKRRSSLTNSTTFKLPKTEPDTLSDQPPPPPPPPPLFQLPNSSLETQQQHPPYHQLNSSYSRQKELGRQRRHRIREKIEKMKELLPSSSQGKKKRLDTATVLENTGKYIKYLEAQVRVLEGMTVEDSLKNEDGLDRNRVLQMMVKSEEIQGKMSSEGMCVYSVEQLVEMIGILFTTEEAYVLLNSVLFSTFAPPPLPYP